MSRHVDYTPEQKAAQLKSAREIALRARARGHDPYAVSNDFWLIALDDEIERLNKWADGFSDAQLKERQTAEAYQRELREYIGKLQKMLHERGCNQWVLDRTLGDAP